VCSTVVIPYWVGERFEQRPEPPYFLFIVQLLSIKDPFLSAKNIASKIYVFMCLCPGGYKTDIVAKLRYPRQVYNGNKELKLNKTEFVWHQTRII